MDALSKNHPSRLLIVTHVVHYRHEGKLFAYGPYAREVEIWADLFPHVEIAAPCRHAVPAGDCLAFSRGDIGIRPQLETVGDGWQAKLRRLVLLPARIWQLLRSMRRADAVHVRCPGDLGLLGVLLAPLVCQYRVAKHAGQWNAFAGERLSPRLQRWLLRSRWWGNPVTVYGEWPNEPSHVHPFFTSMMTSDQVARAVQTSENRTIELPLRVLFSGRLIGEKRVAALLEAVPITLGRGIAMEVTIVGDGPRRRELQQRCAALGIQDHVTFVGALAYEEALSWYGWADCLVLPSVNSEGWPKVIAEAMCHGVVCIAVKHGLLPRMLAGRGVLLESGEAREIADALESVVSDPASYRDQRRRASEWSREYSLDGLRRALAELLEREWDVKLLDPETTDARSCGKRVSAGV